MHAVAFNALRTACRPVPRRACRVVAGVRYPIHPRFFHRSPIIHRKPIEERENGATPPENAAADPVDNENGNGGEDIEDKTGAETSRPTLDDESSSLITRTRKGRNGGSGRLRGNTRRQNEAMPPITLPEWFFTKNVKLVEEPPQSGSLALHRPSQAEDAGDSGVNQSEALEGPSDARYSTHADIYKEVMVTLGAALLIRPPKNFENLDVTRPMVVLDCPKDGGALYLDSIVEKIASEHHADLIRLDAQDLAQIVGPYVDENIAWTYSSTALLGYEAHKVVGQMEEYDEDVNAPAPAAEEEDDTTANVRLPDKVLKSIDALFNSKKNAQRPKNPSSLSAIQVGIFGVDQNQQQAVSETAQWEHLKINAMVNELISAADIKRSAAMPETASEPKPIIVQIKDYKALSGTAQGKELILRFRTSVNRRWKEGRNIICVGTNSVEDQRSVLSRPEIQHLQSDIVEGEKSTIYVPPDRRPTQEAVFEADEKARIRRINIRNLEEMIFKLADGIDFDPVVDFSENLDDAIVEESGLDDAVWTYPKIRRIATIIIGISMNDGKRSGLVFIEALKALHASDEAKFQWGNLERQEKKEIEEETENESTEIKNTFTKDKLRQIKKKCNHHEKKLLSGVVWPADIRTTFDQIRAPKETVEALKTLTSLSLLRPEAFSYGVLATDKIPGLLLYGPPGTGKTLLAKAVAKESGATVLEISGADVNDMFVGEGEKNVKAIFSLAKKLSPCVVFIDEADGIFSARGDTRTGRNNAHRDVINQFLREWDGMNDMSAFIMIATNRPFDLDEAVFRRLPRRLLVDLPVEKDREAILKIHLRDEILDDSVSLSKIAKDTPFYSGSDLKNISVAAALASIREENAAAAKHTGDEPYIYPEKRILTKAHFEKALEEISASISEDMASLSAIRKFDEKYGDRKGRRKKSAALGFGGTRTEERDSEAARVRRIEAHLHP